MKGLIVRQLEGKIVYSIQKDLPFPSFLSPNELSNRWRDLYSQRAIVRVHFAAFNRRDYWIGEGLYPGLKFPCILGSDCAGTVVKVSNSEDSHWIGKEVIVNPGLFWGESEDAQSLEFRILGMPENGTFAEFVEVPVKNLYPKPSHLSFAQAAALPLAGVTAFRAAIVNGKVTKGKHVLITGIGGGVSQMALQFCVALGAKTYVTSSSQEKISRAKELGALGGANYKEENWHKKLIKLANSKFDIVIDSAGGADFGKLVDLLNIGGVIVSYGATAGPPSGFNIFKLFLGNMKILGSTMGSDLDFANLLNFVNEKKIVPPIDSIVDLEDGIKAITQDLKHHQQCGKIVLRVSSPSSLQVSLNPLVNKDLSIL